MEYMPCVSLSSDATDLRSIFMSNSLSTAKSTRIETASIGPSGPISVSHSNGIGTESTR